MTQLTGTGPSVVAQGLRDESSSQLHFLGEVVHSNDGRAFRYCRAGDTALVAGKLQQSSAQDTGDHDIAIAAVSAGDTSVTTTGTVTVTENQYAEGFLNVANEDGEGFLYKISGHAAATAAVVTINIADEVDTAMTTSSKIDLIKNPFDAVIVNPTTLTASPIGVAISDLTSSNYGWLQVKGPASVLDDGGLSVGLDVVASDNVAGSVEKIADGSPELLPKLGTAMIDSTDTEYGIVDFRLM